MAKRSITALQNKIDNEGSSNGNSSTGLFYPHWKLPKDGITKVRFVEDPDEENDLIFYTEYKEHALNIGDEVVRVPCLKIGNIKTPCPICELSSKYYKMDDETIGKKKGKYYYRNLFLLLRGVITKDGLEYTEEEETSTGQTKIFRFSYQLSSALKTSLSQFETGDEPWSVTEGYDFQIVKQINNTPDGEQAKYDAGSTFVRKPTPLEDEWIEGIPSEPLSALIPEIPTYDEAVAILQKHLRSIEGNSDDGDDGDDTSSESDLEAKIARQRKSRSEPAASEPAANESSSPLDGIDDGDDDDDARVMDMLRKNS